MSLCGGAHELIVRDGEAPPHRPESPCDLIDELLRRDSAIGRLGCDLLPVLVHADEEMDVIAGEPPIPRDRVGADFLERMAEVWITVGVVYCSCQVETRQSSALPGRRRDRAARLYVRACALRRSRPDLRRAWSRRLGRCRLPHAHPTAAARGPRAREPWRPRAPACT